MHGLGQDELNNYNEINKEEKIKECNLTFKEAYIKMLQGKKVKRPCFKGYYFIDYLDGKITIHLANGEEIKNGDLQCTLVNVLADDWQVIN